MKPSEYTEDEVRMPYRVSGPHEGGVYAVILYLAKDKRWVFTTRSKKRAEQIRDLMDSAYWNGRGVEHRQMEVMVNPPKEGEL